jgi:hypothetical protein
MCNKIKCLRFQVLTEAMNNDRSDDGGSMHL